MHYINFIIFATCHLVFFRYDSFLNIQLNQVVSRCNVLWISARRCDDMTTEVSVRNAWRYSRLKQILWHSQPWILTLSLEFPTERIAAHKKDQNIFILYIRPFRYHFNLKIKKRKKNDWTFSESVIRLRETGNLSDILWFNIYLNKYIKIINSVNLDIFCFWN